MRRVLVSGLFAFALAGCGTVQESLGGDGADGANFVWLFVLFLAVCTIVYLMVMGGLAGALWRNRESTPRFTVEGGDYSSEPQVAGKLLKAWAIFIVIGLAALAIASFFVDRSNANAAANPRLRITVTGNQWWWAVEYEGRKPGEGFHTANELHLPVGVPVEVVLKSNDVIHSLWIPNLAGKQDLIPGRETDLQLVPRVTGLFRGQCAEFCGIQHAHMALDVTVESPSNFQRWVAAQQRVAFAPVSPLQLAGYRIVTSRQCSSCHAITGTSASANVGPDLTHFASRRSIAAGALPMSRDNVAQWVADPQKVKPGSNMPKVPLSSTDLAAVTAFLSRLQ